MTGGGAIVGSVSSVNPGVANLVQTLSEVNSPVLSSPAAISALEKAPASDIVQLSIEAMQLEGVDAMFGMPNSSAADTSSTPASTASPGDQLTNYQTSLQSAETQALFGSATANPLFDVTG